MVVADSTNATVGKLGESSAEIGKVIKVTTSIAQQTNLLALNATIETARATEDISGKIEAIQADTQGAVEANRPDQLDHQPSGSAQLSSPQWAVTLEKVNTAALDGLTVAFTQWLVPESP